MKAISNPSNHKITENVKLGAKMLRGTCKILLLQPLQHFLLLLLLSVSEDMLSSGCIYQRSYKLLPPGNKRLIWLIFYNDSSRSVSTTRHKCDTTKLRPLSQTNKLGNFKPMPFFHLALRATAIYCYIKHDFLKLFFMLQAVASIFFILFWMQHIEKKNKHYCT